MKSRNIDENGDWTFGKGRGNYAQGTAALMLNVRTRLLSFRNNCFFDMDAGIDWWNMLGGRDRRRIAASAQKTILESYGVAGISSLVPSISGRRLGITAVVRFMDGTEMTDTVEVL